MYQCVSLSACVHVCELGLCVVYMCVCVYVCVCGCIWAYRLHFCVILDLEDFSPFSSCILHWKYINPLGPRPAAALSLRNPMRREAYTTLKINNKHQTKVSAHFVFSPVCEYIVLVYPTASLKFTASLKLHRTLNKRHRGK